MLYFIFKNFKYHVICDSVPALGELEQLAVHLYGTLLAFYVLFNYLSHNRPSAKGEERGTRFIAVEPVVCPSMTKGNIDMILAMQEGRLL